MEHLQNKNATAWMVRRDGCIFPVVQHIYGNVLETEETLFAAEWLYEHTECERTRRDIVDFTLAWAACFGKNEGNEDIREKIYCAIENRPYRLITRKFADKILEWREEAEGGESKNTDETMDINGYCKKVTLDLNEEFMRVRFGGLYHTEPGNRQLYFRVSSENYNWSKVIREFLNQSELDYEEFYVVIDEESAEANPNILKQSRLLNKENFIVRD